MSDPERIQQNLMAAGADFIGISVDAWQAIGAIATAGAFLVAAVAVLVAFMQLKNAREAAEKQLTQTRDTAATQLAHDRETAAAQRAQNQTFADQQLEQIRLVAAEQLDQDRAALREQLAHAAETARDQSRPYVLLSAEVGDYPMAAIDLILQNVGQTAARDVRITVDPPFVRADDSPGSELKAARIFDRPVAMLPPGYRLVSWLDSAIERHESGSHLPDEHRVTIEYHDGRGHSYTDESIIDLALWDGLMFGERYGIHDAAKALREVKKLLEKSPVLKGGFEVVVEDRDARQQRVSEENAERTARHAALVARVEASREVSVAADAKDDDGA